MIKEYINENLAPGNWGYFFVVLSFCAALFSFISYVYAFRKKDEKLKQSWTKFARFGYIIHSISVIGIFSILFYLIYTHQFQYYYVYGHSSKELPYYYMLACFWEGQEGSFLLWTFWNCVLGIFLICFSKSFERGVMLSVALTQVMLSSMLLGLSSVDIFGAVLQLPIKLGSNPFILFRQARPELPLFVTPDYASKILDGRGLNPLLQNYWMVIHPPVLFLGFASTLLPFAFAMAGLLSKRYTEWVKAAIPYSLFNGMLLGTGILMGGAWAYEALSFGGFWAWDPVENASLVPWLIAVAGLHTMNIYRARKSALAASFILTITAFLLILYSTFLTRSGILGNSSVHSFTDLGLSGQLLIFLLVFLITATGLMIYRWKEIPKTKQEESIYSREFWMFLGSLILSLMAFHIITVTSIPVINAINGGINSLLHVSLPTKLAAPADPITAYHLLQIPLAILIALFTGFGQYLKYYKSDKSKFFKNLMYSLAVTLIISVPLLILTPFKDTRYFILMVASVYTVVGNFHILIQRFKKISSVNTKGTGAAISHIGVGLLLLGALLSNGLKQTISINTEGFQVFDDSNKKEQKENKVLYKDFPVKMGDYRVTYTHDTMESNYIYYNIDYIKFARDGKTKDESFTLRPYAIFDKNQGKITAPSPDTRHYFSKDIFTHITAAVDKNAPEYQVVYDTAMTYNVTEGQTIKIDSFNILFKSITSEQGKTEAGRDIYKVTMEVLATDGLFTQKAFPAFVLEDKGLSPEPAEMHDFGLKFYYTSVNTGQKSHQVTIYKGKRPTPDFITLKAIVFPWISVLWIGCFIMIFGFGVAMFGRIKEGRRLAL